MSTQKATDFGDYKFYYTRKIEDFFDKDLFNFAMQDMFDKYFGNAEKERIYKEALERVKNNIVQKTFRFINGNGNVQEGSYQTIEYYSKINDDLKLLQLEEIQEKLEKVSKYSAGDTSVYTSEKDLEEDRKYLDTNNFAYNRNAITTQNLKTLGRYGENVTTPSKILNTLLIARNKITAPINRFIGRGVSKAYGNIFTGNAGLYSNKRTHRYSARRNFFLNEERKKANEQGKKFRIFPAIMKARLKAITNYKEGNDKILKYGEESIRASMLKIQEAKLLEDKYKAVTYHIKDLMEKYLIITNTEEKAEIRKQLSIAINEKDKIEQSPIFVENNIQKIGLSQTDAITLEEHIQANKDNVTRVISGIKMAGVAGIRYAGPKIRDWILEHSQIKRLETQREWVPGYYEQQWIPGKKVEVKSYTEEELLNNFQINKLMEASNDKIAYYSYGDLEKVVNRTGLNYFRGAAQKIDGKVISLSDGNGFDITGITNGILPQNILVNGHISDQATLFDIIAALRTKAGKATTRDEIIQTILKENSIEAQNRVIKELTEGLEFWESINKKGIATGWNDASFEINTVIDKLSDLIKSKNIETEGHYAQVFIDGFWKEVQKEVTVINPRILKACNITENMVKGLTTAEIVEIIYENLRSGESSELEEILAKPDPIQRSRRKRGRLSDILKEKDPQKRLEKALLYSRTREIKEIAAIDILQSFNDQPELLLELLSDDSFYSKTTLKLAFEYNLSLKEKKEIITNPRYNKLLEKIRDTEFYKDEVEFLIESYNKEKIFLELFMPNTKTFIRNEETILRKLYTEYNEEIVNRLLELNNIKEDKKNEIKNKLKELFEINEEILETVNFKLLTNKYREIHSNLPTLTVYPEIQKQICSLTDKEYEFLSKAIYSFERMEYDWVTLTSDVLAHISDYYELINHDEGFQKYIKNINPNKPEDCESLLKTIKILTEKNEYEITNYNQLKNFKRNDRFEIFYENRSKTAEFQKLSEYDKLRELTLEKLFGQDLKTAKRILEFYGQDYDELIKESQENDEEIEKYIIEVKKVAKDSEEFKNLFKAIKNENKIIRNYLETIRNILEEEDYDKLKEKYKISANQQLYIPTCLLESRFREFYTRSKNKTLYMPKEKDLISVEGEEAYLISDDFNLQLTSIESYASDTWIFKKDTTKKVLDWDCKKIKAHGISTVMCGSGNLSLPPIHGVCYGFANINERALLKSAPWDLGAWSYNQDFDITRAKADFGTKFTTPKTQIRESLRRHNEDVLERRNLDYEPGEKFKLQPSYLISFVEPKLKSYFKFETEEVLTSEVLKQILDLNKFNNKAYETTLVKEELLKDPKWEKTIQESKRKNLKKVVVNRTHTLIQARIENDKKEEKLLQYTNDDLNNPKKMKEFLTLLEDIIYDFDAARAGCIQREIKGWNSDGGSNYGDIIHKEMYEKLYSYKVMDDKLGKIEKKLRTLDKDKFRKCMEKMAEISEKQVGKIEKSYWWYEYDTSHDWYDYYKFASRELSGIRFGEDEEKITQMLEKTMTGTTQKGGEVIAEIIEEIKDIHEYDIPPKEPDWHGRRHINNVVLFSYLIAENEGKLKKDMKLLLQAAKFHDVGRDGNWNGQGDGHRHDKDEIPHAHPSANAAEYYLRKEVDQSGQRKYTDSQIAMIKVAIEYHEVNEKNKRNFNKEIFNQLCKKEGVRQEDIENTKLMCIYLKDADALDRTRFLYKEKDKGIKEQKDNLDLRYLRTNTAIALRDYAREINDEYTVKKKKGIKELGLPKYLNKYKSRTQRPKINWEEEKKEIARYNAEINQKNQNDAKTSLGEKELRQIIYTPQSKEKMLRGRSKFKKFIDTVKNKIKKER